MAVDGDGSSGETSNSRGCRQDAALSRALELKKAALQHPKLQCKLREVRFVKEKVAIVDQLHPCVPA